MNDAVGRRIAGRTAGLHLNERGRDQARRLVPRLSGVPLRAVYSSPLERAVETATPLAEQLGLGVEVLEGLTELDFGYRTACRPPGGESLLEAQLRMVGTLEELAARHPEDTIAVFGHGDPLKAAIAHYVGLSVELLLRVQLEPASVSLLRLAPWGAELRCLGVTNTLAELVV
jgi:broad specificity phosphatase PhoE